MIRIDYIGMPPRDAKASALFLRDTLGLDKAKPEVEILRSQDAKD
jgi:hypothetical protein